MRRHVLRYINLICRNIELPQIDQHAQVQCLQNDSNWEVKKKIPSLKKAARQTMIQLSLLDILRAHRTENNSESAELKMQIKSEEATDSSSRGELNEERTNETVVPTISPRGTKWRRQPTVQSPRQNNDPVFVVKSIGKATNVASGGAFNSKTFGPVKPDHHNQGLSRKSTWPKMTAKNGTPSNFLDINKPLIVSPRNPDNGSKYK